MRHPYYFPGSGSKEYIALLPLDENGQNQEWRSLSLILSNVQNPEIRFLPISKVTKNTTRQAMAGFDTVLQNAKDSVQNID